MKTKIFGIVSLFCLIFTALWLAFMILYMSKIGPIDTLEQAIDSVANPGWLFYLSYVNVVILTISVTILFAGLYLYCKPIEPELSIIGIIFVPVYCVLNLFSYFSQITIVPRLLTYQTIADHNTESKILLGLMIQLWGDSAVWVFNNLGYAILGISSMAFGLALLNKGKFAKVSGILLILNAIACIAGIIGIAAGNKIIGMGSTVGGVFFIIALVFLSLMFFKEVEQ